MSLFTVLGAGGFVGSHLVRHLESKGHTVHAVERGQPVPASAGHAIYCIGLTADFRQRPFDTVEAHVTVLHGMLRSVQFDTFTYLSSTRVYQRLPADRVAHESDDVKVDANDPSDLYNISKLMGESLCLAHANPAVRAVRLSNVFGGGDRSENFLTSLLRDAVAGRHVVLRSAADVSKDYIDIENVVSALERVPERAQSRIINIASGRNTSNAEILELLRRHTGCTAEVAPDAAAGSSFPRISIDRMRNELGIVPGNLDKSFAKLVADFRIAPAAEQDRALAGGMSESGGPH